jgi:hypothetical protein
MDTQPKTRTERKGKDKKKDKGQGPYSAKHVRAQEATVRRTQGATVR